jgi:four helix bundle protein
MKYLTLNDIDSYKRSLALSNYVWEVVEKWEWFAKQTVGTQFVRAVDSVSANIAEGFGRYKKQDKIHFYRISFGSMMESLDWNQKAKSRGLLTGEQYEHILKELKALPLEINQLVKFTREKLEQ